MTAPNLDRAYGVTNIKAHIPIVLDMNEHNYDPWCELVLIHCLSFDVLGHLDGSTLPANDNDLPWKKKDGFVKLWLYGTISKDIFTSCFKTGATAHQIWTTIEALFRGNKEARAIQLDNDLRTKEIGDRTVHIYFQELKTIADLLANVDAPVADRTLVTYMLNGLNDKFDNIINVIKHRQPFPTFTQAREMLISEEDRLTKIKKSNPSHTDTPSSSTVLAATHDQTPPNPNTPNNRSQSSSRGNYRGGRRGRGRGRNGNRPPFQQWYPPYWTNPFQFWSQPYGPNQFNQWPTNQNTDSAGILGPRPHSVQQNNHHKCTKTTTLKSQRTPRPSTLSH